MGVAISAGIAGGLAGVTKEGFQNGISGVSLTLRSVAFTTETRHPKAPEDLHALHGWPSRPSSRIGRPCPVREAASGAAVRAWGSPSDCQSAEADHCESR